MHHLWWTTFASRARSIVSHQCTVRTLAAAIISLCPRHHMHQRPLLAHSMRWLRRAAGRDCGGNSEHRAEQSNVEMYLRQGTHDRPRCDVYTVKNHRYTHRDAYLRQKFFLQVRHRMGTSSVCLQLGKEHRFFVVGTLGMAVLQPLSMWSASWRTQTD